MSSELDKVFVRSGESPEADDSSEYESDWEAEITASGQVSGGKTVKGRTNIKN